MKIGNNDFDKEFLYKVGGQIREYLIKFEGSIYGVKKITRINGKYLGCGTFFKEGDDCFMLTAMHVAQEADKFDYAMHSRRQQLNCCPFRGVWLGDRIPETDIAIYGCFAEMIEESNLSPIEEGALYQTVSKNVQGQLFYCQGIPGADTTFLPMMRQYIFGSHPIMGLGLPSESLENPNYTFSFQYPRGVNPRGMSGSAVWNTNLHLINSEDEWHLDLLTFAGFIQKWIPSKMCLVSTKADSLKSFIPIGRELLRKMWREDPESNYE